jgi:Type IV secretion system pilin
MDFSFVPSVAAAGSIIDASGSYSPADIIRTWVSLVVLVAGLCSILFIVWGGLMLILSGGKDEKVKPAINSIRYAVIGIIVIVIAIFVAPKVSEMLGLGQHQYLSPQSIFDTIKKLMNQIFGSGNETYFDSSSSGGLPAGFSDL